MSATSVLIVGESGSGKTTAAETLPPAETFIINVASKPLPYKGWKANYTELTGKNPTGNMLNGTSSDAILQTLEYINTKRPEIKYVVLDDNQYIAADYLMAKA